MITEDHGIRAIGYLGARLKELEDNGERIPEPPELLDLWREALRATQDG